MPGNQVQNRSTNHRNESQMGLLDNLRITVPEFKDGFCYCVEKAPHQGLDQIHAYQLSLKMLEPLLQRFDLSALPSAIRRCAWRRQLEFIGGRLSAELALERSACAHPHVGRSVLGVPIWPPGFVGSITHNKDFAYAAVARKQVTSVLGIDSEPIVDADAAKDIIKICCTPEERALWFRGGSNTLMATLLFSAKEAIHKAVHPSCFRYIEFTEVQLQSVSWHRSILHFQPTPGGSLVNSTHRLDVAFSLRDRIVHTTVCEFG
jgi:enterobactin synthetase component D